MPIKMPQKNGKRREEEWESGWSQIPSKTFVRDIIK